MPVILFDLDGTLTDPRPGILGCIRYALEALGRPVPAEEALLWCIGPPLRDVFMALLGGEAEADQAVALYRQRFTTIGLYENAVYPGVPELLAALHRTAATLAVATSKPEVYATRILEHFELAAFFPAVFGSELTGERTDKSELIAHALMRMGASAADAIMVGDRSHDMIGARHNGVRGVGVLYGYGSREELLGAGAQVLVDSPAAVLNALRLEL